MAYLGTPRLITDDANNTVWRNLPTTEPFGNSPPEEDPNGTGNRFTFNLRFPGQYADRETNTNYNTFRDYDPRTGRYVQSDPIGLQGGINTYAYVKNDPLRRTDPAGLWSLSVSRYYGVGDGVSITGTGWHIGSITFEGGAGLGGGVAFNPWGGKPDSNAPPNSNSLGVAVGGSVGLGPVSIGKGWNYGGTQSCSLNWNEYGGSDPEYTTGKSYGGIPIRVGGFAFEAEVRAAVQITHNF